MLHVSENCINPGRKQCGNRSLAHSLSHWLNHQTQTHNTTQTDLNSNPFCLHLLSQTLNSSEQSRPLKTWAARGTNPTPPTTCPRAFLNGVALSSGLLNWPPMMTSPTSQSLNPRRRQVWSSWGYLMTAPSWIWSRGLRSTAPSHASASTAMVSDASRTAPRIPPRLPLLLLSTPPSASPSTPRR